MYISAKEPRVECPIHGVVAARVPWSRHNSRFTREFEELVTWLAMNCSKLIFRCEERESAKEELDSWIKWAQHCRIKVFVELQRKIRRYYDAILAAIENHLSNAILEATNRKINLSIYMAYGFRNIDNLIDMVMLRCSDIDVLLPWEKNWCNSFSASAV